MRLFSTVMQGRLGPRKSLKLIRLVVGELQGKRKMIGPHLIHVGNLPHVGAAKGTSHGVQTVASHGRGTAAPPPTTKEGAGPALALVEVEIHHLTLSNMVDFLASNAVQLCICTNNVVQARTFKISTRGISSIWLKRLILLVEIMRWITETQSSPPISL